jgi:hypothetical protein
MCTLYVEVRPTFTGSDEDCFPLEDVTEADLKTIIFPIFEEILTPFPDVETDEQFSLKNFGLVEVNSDKDHSGFLIILFSIFLDQVNRSELISNLEAALFSSGLCVLLRPRYEAGFPTRITTKPRQ